MNPLPERLTRGTFGELLVQIRLLQHSVQAAPPVKDSGNDLIAICGDQFRAVQVKTTARAEVTLPAKKLKRTRWHILAIVRLVSYNYKPDAEHIEVELDKAEVYLLQRREVKKYSYTWDELLPFRFSRDLVVRLFRQEPQRQNGALE